MQTNGHENRETFFRRLQPFFGPSTLYEIELAYILSKHGHRAQVRKELDTAGDPVRYFEHVRRVTLILIDEVQCVRAEMVCAAILHDAFEDTREITPGLVERFLGREVTSIVKVLSKDPKEGYLDRFAVCTDWRPYLIKGCDRLHNLRSLTNTTPEFQKKQLEETVTKYYRLFDRMVTLAPIEHRDGASRLRDLIVAEVHKLSGR